MKKRILPALLALCMVMSLLPTVFAADPVVNKCTCIHGEGEAPSDCVGTEVAEGVTAVEGVCAACKANATCNPCEKKDQGCTLAEHEEGTPHTGATECTNDSGCPIATTGTHESTCPKRACGFGGEGGKCTLVYGHQEGENGTPHKNRVCAGSNSSEKCGATSHTGDCDMKCTCTVDAVHGKDAQGHSNGCKNTIGEHTVSGNKVCDACYKNAKCNPCNEDGTEGGCTLYKGHQGAHTGRVCTEDAKCTATTHTGECQVMCGNSEEDDAVDGCTLTYGHSAKHNVEGCLGEEDENDDTRCPGDENGLHGKDCVNFVVCPICAAGKTEEEVAEIENCVGHAKANEEDHDNDRCLGVNDDGWCGADNHIAGCSKAKCECQTENAELKHEGCTGKAGCPACAKLDNCSCPVCRSNPATGALTNAEGEEVENPVAPSEDEKPTKAEEFTDMEDWMAEAVQVMLDNGWMEGIGDGKFEGRVEANTNMVLTVIARMSGETITGATWADDAKAWAEENELTEGIEITKADIARQDVVLLLWRLAGKPDSDYELSFTDVDGLEGDLLTAMKWAAEMKIVVGNGDGTANPEGSVTRAELATLVSRYAALEK